MNLRQIKKAYEKQVVFDGLDLEIQEGEILCVLGESGGGKTTLLHILAGLIPFEGSKENVPKDISYIFQETRILPHMTVRQNLQFIGGSEEKIEEVLTSVEMADKSHKRPPELSGGEKQRVAIARAFCVGFSLILMDEPFSSLDTALKIRLIQAFASLWEQKKSEGERPTAVFVTHDVEEALAIADRIVVLKKGEICFDRRVERSTFPSAYLAPTPLREEILKALDVK